MNNEISFLSFSRKISKDLNFLLEKHLSSKEYTHSEARIWNNQIVQKTLQFL